MAGPFDVAYGDVAHGQVRRQAGLYDLELSIATDGGLARPDRRDVSLTAAQLADLVRRAGAGDCDLRILAAPGEQNLPMLRAVARMLGRDVLVAPTGARVVQLRAREHPAPRQAADGGDEHVPVDAETGHPVDWLTVTPDGQVGVAFGWFDTVGALVVQRSGLVAFPLADGGRMLATRETFVRTRAAAATVRPAHPGLVTLGVEVRAGDFLVAYYDRGTVLVDGPGLAAALSTLPLYRANLRMWLRWPAAARDRQRLKTNLTAFADMTGATVWAPAESAEATLLDACLDLAAVDRDGRPASWQSYGPATAFESDMDGRLVPVGGIRVANLPAARVVSGHPARQRELAAQPPRSEFTCDLAVLADGRLAVRYHDGSLLAVGGRQFTWLMREAGWAGGEVLLLSSVAPEQATGTSRHLADLVTHLGAPIRSASAEPSPQTPPVVSAPRIAAPPVAAPRVSAQRIAAPPVAAPPVAAPRAPEPLQPDRQRAQLPVPTQAVDRPGEESGWASAAASIAAPLRASAVASAVAYSGAGQDPVAAQNSVAARDGGADDPFGAGPRPNPSRFIDGPRLMTATSSPSHGLDWLPAQPQTNATGFRLFVACDPDPEVAITSGVPSPTLFLAGHLGRERLAERTTAAHLLEVDVAPGGAIDLPASETFLPGAFAPLLGFNDVYVLPVGWLSRCRIVASYRITRDRGTDRRREHDGVPLLLTPDGAGHGVRGLPTEVVGWPKARWRPVATRFVVVPQTGGLGPWLRLYADRPDPSAGAWLLSVRLERDQAIDVAATAASLTHLSSIRSAAPDLVAAGVDVLLPADAYDAVALRGAWRSEHGAWREVTLGGSRRLGPWGQSEFRAEHACAD